MEVCRDARPIPRMVDDLWVWVICSYCVLDTAMKDKRKDRWHNGWTPEEDQLLLIAIQETGSRKRAAHRWLLNHGVDRTEKAVNNRAIYLAGSRKPTLPKEPLPKGWGYV